MSSSGLFLGSLTLLMLILASCARAPTATPGGTTAEAQVVMRSLAFVPKELTIQAGTKVTWTNEDSFAHTVTSGTRGNPTGMFDETVQAGGTFSFTFEQPGTYDYFCSIHPGMDGVVIVQ
jgi:plastocyanin